MRSYINELLGYIVLSVFLITPIYFYAAFSLILFSRTIPEYIFWCLGNMQAALLLIFIVVGFLYGITKNPSWLKLTYIRNGAENEVYLIHISYLIIFVLFLVDSYEYYDAINSCSDQTHSPEWRCRSYAMNVFDAWREGWRYAPNAWRLK